MNNETKQVISALLAGRTYIFSLLHTLLGAEPTADMIAAATGEASMQAITLFEQDDAQAPKLLAAALKILKDADLAALKSEYTRLFLGPDFAAAPWESVYTTKERALFQESTLNVRLWFKRYGYVAGGYPNFPDDHISLMMDFLARTTQMATAQLTCGNDENASAEILKDQAEFERAHLLNWLKAYAKDMQMSESNVFYPQLAVAIAEFIAYDQQVIGEMVEACAAE